MNNQAAFSCGKTRKQLLLAAQEEEEEEHRKQLLASRGSRYFTFFPTGFGKSLVKWWKAKPAVTNLIGPIYLPSFASPSQTLSMGFLPDG